MKQCWHCNEVKPLEDFFWKIKGETKEAVCKVCSSSRAKNWRDANKHKLRDTAYKKKFGISLEEYDTKLKNQKYCCAICGIHENKVKLRFAVDHNHKTGEVRDLLCGQCNVAVGMVKEDLTILTSMISYLMEHGETNES